MAVTNLPDPHQQVAALALALSSVCEDNGIRLDRAMLLAHKAQETERAGA